MLDCRGFLRRGQDHPRGNVRAGGQARNDVPQAVAVERRRAPAAAQEVSFLAREPVERPLHAVEDRAQRPGPSSTDSGEPSA